VRETLSGYQQSGGANHWAEFLAAW
jgi:hypothetical protein